MGHVRGNQVSGTKREPTVFIISLETSLVTVFLDRKHRYYLALATGVYHQPLEVKRSASKGLFEVSVFEVQKGVRPQAPHIPCLYDTLI